MTRDDDRLAGFLDDLAMQADAAMTAERDLEVVERARAEYARVTLAARLMASLDRTVELSVDGVDTLTGRLERVADGWLLLHASGAEWIVRLAAVSSARGVVARAVPAEAWPVTARLGVGSALRGLAGETCVVRLRDTTAHEGRLGRVGADFVELLQGERVTLVALASIAALRTTRP